MESWQYQFRNYLLIILNYYTRTSLVVRDWTLVLLMPGAWVPSLVGKLGSTCCNRRSCMRQLRPSSKAMMKLDSVLKIRDVTLPEKVYLVKVMVFPVVMYGCENWIIKKVECWRLDASKLWCWRRLLRVPWTARSNQSIPKEINPEYSLEGLMLKLQYFGHLIEELTHQKRPWCW